MRRYEHVAILPKPAHDSRATSRPRPMPDLDMLKTPATEIIPRVRHATAPLSVIAVR
jgi:hypothetical protein